MNKFAQFALLVCAIANIILFWPGNLYFLNDDFIHLPLTDQGVFFQTNSIRPIHEWLTKLDVLVWGNRAFGYHLTTLVLHAFVCIQVYDLCIIWRRQTGQNTRAFAIVAVVLFLVYPQHSESLGWIIGRGPILSSVFLLASVRLMLLHHTRTSRVWMIAGATFFLCALLSYEQPILMPLAVLVGGYLIKDDRHRRALRTYGAILICTTVLYLIARQYISSEILGDYEATNFTHFNVVTLIGNAVRLLLRLVVNPGSNLAFLGSVLVFLGGAIVIVWLKRQTITHGQSDLKLLALSVLLLITPVLSLGISTHSFESGRFLYLPSIFLVIALAKVVTSYWNEVTRPEFVGRLTVIILVSYWCVGKVQAALNYQEASAYAQEKQEKLKLHFQTSTGVYNDTVQTTVDELPVYRIGFKEGAKWLNPQIDTSLISVLYLAEHN